MYAYLLFLNINGNKSINGFISVLLKFIGIWSIYAGSPCILSCMLPNSYISCSITLIQLKIALIGWRWHNQRQNIGGEEGREGYGCTKMGRNEIIIRKGKRRKEKKNCQLMRLEKVMS